MPMHISPDSSINSPLFRTGPIVGPLSSATQSDVHGILQREQDYALSLLSLSPLLSSLFTSYANRAAALELASAIPSPESEEWKTLQTTTTALREENEKLKLEAREMAEKLEAAEASREAFRSQVSSLKEINTAQQEDIKSLWAELFEAGDKYDRLAEDSNAEKTALQAQVSGLEAQRLELKETVVEQQLKISRFERRTTDDVPTYRPPSTPALPVRQPMLYPSAPGSPTFHVRVLSPEQGEAAPSPPLTPTISSDSHGPSKPRDIPPSLDPFGKSSKRSAPVIHMPTMKQNGKAPSHPWLKSWADGL